MDNLEQRDSTYSYRGVLAGFGNRMRNFNPAGEPFRLDTQTNFEDNPDFGFSFGAKSLHFDIEASLLHRVHKFYPVFCLVWSQEAVDGVPTSGPLSRASRPLPFLFLSGALNCVSSSVRSNISLESKVKVLTIPSISSRRL